MFLFLISFLTSTRKTLTSSGDHPKAFWKRRITSPSKLLRRFSISHAPSSFIRLSLGHILQGSLKTFKVTSSKPRSSNQPFHRMGSSTGVPKIRHDWSRLSENFWKAPSLGTVLSSEARTPVTLWNSTQPPGFVWLENEIISESTL